MATLTIADLDNGKRDLQTVSEVANSRAATSTTRFGAQTTTLYEAIRRISADGEAQLDQQKTAAEEVIRSLGFRVPVEYAPGLDVSDSRFTVTGPDGKVYAPLSAPFTTGAWEPSQWYVLQNDLNDHKLLVFNNYVAASAAAATLPDGQVVDAEDVQERYEVKSGALVFKAVLNKFTAASGAIDRTIQQKLGDFISTNDFPNIGPAFAYTYANKKPLVVMSSQTIRIPSDAPSLQAVVDTCVKGVPDVQLSVLLEPGYKFDSPTLVEKRDCSWITVQSVDAEVGIAPAWSGQNLLTAVNAFAPIWDILVNAAGAPLGFGLYIRRNSDCEVRPGKGVKNVNSSGIVDYPTGIIVVETSRAHIPESVFTGNYRNLWVSMASNCNATGAKLNGATGDYAVQAVRSSLLHLSQAEVNDAANNAVYANNGVITFLESEAKNAGTALFAEYRGVIYTRPRAGNLPSISGSRTNAVVASNSGVIVIEGAGITAVTGSGFLARDGGVIHANDTKIEAPSTSLLSYNEGSIILTGAGQAKTSSTSANAVRAFQGGRINVDGAVILGGSSGLVAETGGVINARGCNVSGQASSPILASGGDVNVESSVLSKSTSNVDVILARRGGRVRAYGSTISGGRFGAHADTGGYVDVGAASITGASTNGVRATGGELYAQGATIQNNTGKDLDVRSGGIIRAAGSTTTNSVTAGTPNATDANVAFNSVSASGLIFA